ncbi:ABC transporter ATP-binding protein [Clostridium sp. CM028]|uniref:ABC transporter ATP-binding protein n=1 Tax=unclassified Clostridium TaxID=2614128 RepID=UPI001C0D0900|nr:MULTISPECIES: ABC transporter ATP-binding protein [unclassified Clostridium]MBU3091063.1 ABC transporter ATP-binding protein [Clostridium sp. CF011]MBW9144956.1 ABC transporter ATP-binding protein [Clostridium sp. CM027]MBW9148625.1 ABC transporter ATP-binding protein [Clostridium sp. CM028]UVE40094.1 ABC transporter ATP-binding protein [Clostridium sp. CM027]WAG69018.1 ABC transporter ATP-binding protein [Clostridium sp. CF011]
MNAIEIKNLTKSYGKARGITNVSFNVEQGEIFGFIGPNGAGKSTTIRTLLSLIYPTSGSATIFGKDCIEFGPEIRKEIGYLPSEIFYYDNMKVIDLLKYSASFYKKDCSKRITELAEIMDLDLNKKIDDLSFGNKKKVGIVQGLLHSPKLIILDEPTSGLDPLMQQKFFELLEEENKKGATILLSSHILSEVQRLCNRVAIIKEGKIIKVDKISTLQESNHKKIKIEVKSKIDDNYFKISGVANLDIKDNVVSFLFSGNINFIMKKISEIEISNLWIEEPDLEEIFMHYYEKED